MISLRLMEDTTADYIALRSWFLDPELQEWVWCDKKGEQSVSLERIIEKYGARVKNPSLIFPYFILRDNTPIGFIQYYLQKENAIGLDMWIGTPEERNKGYGTQALQQMVQIIKDNHPHAKRLFIDPDSNNLRAIRCYRKAGFQVEKEITDEDGNKCLLLQIML